MPHRANTHIEHAAVRLKFASRRFCSVVLEYFRFRFGIRILRKSPLTQLYLFSFFYIDTSFEEKKNERYEPTFMPHGGILISPYSISSFFFLFSYNGNSSPSFG